MSKRRNPRKRSLFASSRQLRHEALERREAKLAAEIDLMRNSFASIDVDGDGTVSELELELAYPGIANKLLPLLDSDGDGLISVDEFAKGFKSLEQLLKQAAADACA